MQHEETRTNAPSNFSTGRPIFFAKQPARIFPKLPVGVIILTLSPMLNEDDNLASKKYDRKQQTIWAKILDQLIELTAPSLKFWLVSWSLNSALTMSYSTVNLQPQIRILVNSYLTIIECAFNRQIVDICIQDSGHLVLLTGTYTTFWVHDKYRHIFLASETINRRRSGLHILVHFLDTTYGPEVLHRHLSRRRPSNDICLLPVNPWLELARPMVIPALLLTHRFLPFPCSSEGGNIQKDCPKIVKRLWIR